jgi:AcrR family transcriptional regulator
MQGVPEPPWRESRDSPKTPLTRQAIVEAALRVLDRDGMDALSMRKVGEELGTGAASLYWHVRNKEELLQLVFEAVSEEAALPPPDPARWQAQLREVAREMRRTMQRHRDVARISLGRIPAGPTLARTSEWLFELLQPVGIPDQVIAYLGDLMGLYVGAFAFEESLGVASPTGEDLPPDEIVQMFRDYVASLPDDRFPRTKAAVDLLFGSGDDDRFAFGVDVLIRGLETYATSGGATT